ncbi:MAG TPA: hypothetical protein PKW79_00330 [Rhabdochlamydiaceae bacterium]|nr:hypothetical protein [Rhabdochlamydiaceae bacterium]
MDGKKDWEWLEKVRAEEQSAIIGHPSTELELLWFDKVQDQREYLRQTLACIRTIREALENTIPGFVYAWEDLSDQYYQNKISNVKAALEKAAKGEFE